MEFNEFAVTMVHELRTPREEIVFIARPKIQSKSQIFRYGRSALRRPHQPNFSDSFELCLHWVSVVRAIDHARAHCSASKCYCIHTRIEPQVLGMICMVTHTLRGSEMDGYLAILGLLLNAVD